MRHGQIYMPGQSLFSLSMVNQFSSDHLELFTDASGNIGYMYASYLAVGGLQILGPNLYTATI